MKRQVDLAKLRKELARAVEAEDYERAAKLRDQIKQAEG
jgi:protein arginine kinase activator